MSDRGEGRPTDEEVVYDDQGTAYYQRYSKPGKRAKRSPGWWAGREESRSAETVPSPPPRHGREPEPEPEPEPALVAPAEPEPFEPEAQQFEAQQFEAPQAEAQEPAPYDVAEDEVWEPAVEAEPEIDWEAEAEPEGEAEEWEEPRGSRRRRGRSLIPLLVLALVGGALVFGGVVAYGKVKERLAPPEDYAGPGAGKVLFQVQEGQSAGAIGRGLRSQDVVKSVDAFVDAARKDSRSTGIQVGYYELKKQMKAATALGVLVDPKNLIDTTVTVPEGARVRQIVNTVVARTKGTDEPITKAALTAALKQPQALGIPASAGGNPEGYLYPATYSVTPGMTATDLLKAMVAKTVAVEEELDLVRRAQAVNLSVEQVLTVASILEYEANRSVDYPKVARVIYNRLDKDMALQLDSTVSYVSGRSGDVWTTAAERDSDSQYNTYKVTGLPPGPIGSPGKETIEAALAPAKGPWLFFVPDYENDSTVFSATYAEHQKAVARTRAYCRTHEEC